MDQIKAGLKKAAQLAMAGWAETGHTAWRVGSVVLRSTLLVVAAAAYVVFLGALGKAVWLALVFGWRLL
jgi:hypothetical protein